MRSHIFKVWDSKKKLWLTKPQVEFLHKEITWGNEFFLEIKETLEDYDPTRYIFVQSTGLKDKKGTDVFEADWLQSDDGRKYFIVWAEDEARFELENFEDHSLRHINDVRVMTIIGNNYEKEGK